MLAPTYITLFSRGLPLLQVWDAWLRFVLERRRKKARLEQAALFYHSSLVHKGITRLLRFVAGMKSFRGHFHAQRQAQVRAPSSP